jgi:hypothetical protein
MRYPNRLDAREPESSLLPVSNLPSCDPKASPFKGGDEGRFFLRYTAVGLKTLWAGSPKVKPLRFAPPM